MVVDGINARRSHTRTRVLMYLDPTGTQPPDTVLPAHHQPDRARQPHVIVVGTVRLVGSRRNHKWLRHNRLDVEADPPTPRLISALAIVAFPPCQPAIVRRPPRKRLNTR